MATMDINTLTDDDLASLLEWYREHANKGNRVFFDMFCIVERVMLARYRHTDIADYQHDHLVEAIAETTQLIDSLQANNPDTHPKLRFLLENATVLIEEYERRGGSTATH